MTMLMKKEEKQILLPLVLSIEEEEKWAMYLIVMSLISGGTCRSSQLLTC